MGACVCGNKDKSKQNMNSQNNKESPSKITPQFNNKINNSLLKPTHENTLQRGHGHFGTVRVAQQRLSELAPKESQTLKNYAVKTIQKYKLNKELHLLRREVEMLYKLDHPNVIKMYSTYEDQKYFHIVMEFCQGGELFDRILEKQNFTEQEAAEHFSKMMSAVQHLHQNEIAHRDIKSENFLFESNDPESEIKLIDFGLSNKFSNEKDMKTMVGTPYYVAPEVLNGNYGKECDVWSLGIVLYSMLSGTLPFGGANNVEIFRAIKHANISFSGNSWKAVSAEAKSLIKLLLQKDPLTRITLNEAFEHDWFRVAKTKTTEIPLEILENIRNYKANIKLRKEAMIVIVKTLQTSEIQQLNKVFHVIDKDKTGYIHAHELEEAMKQCGLNLAQEEIQSIIRETDYVGNGKINYSEFVAATLNSKVYMNEEKLWAAFSYFDTDKSGYITEENLIEVFGRIGKKVTNEEVKAIIADVDLAKDGKISFDEFKYMMDPQGLLKIKHNQNGSNVPFS